MFDSMSGRKPIYDVESLEIGQKMKLPPQIHPVRFQYLRNFNGRDQAKKYKLTREGKKIFVERVK